MPWVGASVELIPNPTDLRFVPEIEFVSDTSAARAARISKLLREASGDR